MKLKLLIILGIMCIVYGSYAQTKIDRDENTGLPDEGIIVFQGKLKISSVGKKYSFAYAKGDKVVLKYTTRKDKKLKEVWFSNANGYKIWHQTNVASLTKEFSIKEEGVYTIGFLGKGMALRETTIEIIRKPGNQKDFNTAWMPYYNYESKDVNYTIDSAIGYAPAIITKKELKVFDRYLYKNVELVHYKNQILAQMGIHNSQAKPFKLGIDPNKVPKNAKLKGYTYSLSSVLGGKKHWVIADITVTAGALFLSPLGAFAAHGAMAIIGPAPGNEPVQYFLTDNEADLKVIREIYSPHNTARKLTNVYKDGLGEVAGLFSGSAKKAIKGTKVHEYNEGQLHYNQKGKVTNMLVYSATPPSKDLMILANPDYTHAKNIKLTGSAIYYVPKYKLVNANEYHFDLKKVPLSKTKKQYTTKLSYGSIKN